MIRSMAQRQREYRKRLKLKNSDLLRERERRKWHQRQMRQRLRSTVEAPVIGMKHPDIDNSVHSVKYPIRDLLRWLEKVEVDDKVKYGFLKYIHHLNATRVKFNFVMLIIEIKCILNGMQ